MKFQIIERKNALILHVVKTFLAESQLSFSVVKFSVELLVPPVYLYAGIFINSTENFKKILYWKREVNFFKLEAFYFFFEKSCSYSYDHYFELYRFSCAFQFSSSIGNQTVDIFSQRVKETRLIQCFFVSFQSLRIGRFDWLENDWPQISGVSLAWWWFP